MSSYNLEFNKDNSIIRYIIVAFLSEMHNTIKFTNIIGEDEKVEISIPFYYSVTGSERFLIDAFLKDVLVDENNDNAIGTYDQVPRGIVQLDSISIDAGSLVNKFVRAEINQKINNELKTFSYETAIIPLIFSFNVVILANNNIEMFKITESLIRTFYKNKTFQIDLGGYRVAGNIKLPEDIQHNKLFEYGFTDKKLHQLEFGIEVYSFLPDFAEETKMFKGNRIEKFIHTIDSLAKVPYPTIHPFSNQSEFNQDSNNTGYTPSGPGALTQIITGDETDSELT